MYSSKQSRYFNGYVRNSGPMVFMIISAGIFVIIVALLCTVLLFGQSVPRNLQQVTTHIYYLQTEEDSVRLHTDAGVFSVPIDLACDYSVLKNSVADHAKLTICYKPFPENHEVKGSVWELTDSKGIIFLDKEVVKAYQKENYRLMAQVSWITTIIYFIFTFMLCFFLSNAPKYPRIAALFVKKQWRNF